jgi:hypothetical protein
LNRRTETFNRRCIETVIITPPCSITSRAMRSAVYLNPYEEWSALERSRLHSPIKRPSIISFSSKSRHCSTPRGGYQSNGQGNRLDLNMATCTLPTKCCQANGRTTSPQNSSAKISTNADKFQHRREQSRHAISDYNTILSSQNVVPCKVRKCR